MRVLMTAWAWPSQFHPLVPLGWALRAAGHDVRVAAMPAMADVVARSGLPAVATGTDLDPLPAIRQLIPGRQQVVQGGSDAVALPAPALRQPRVVEVFAAIAEAMADDLVRYARAYRPDVVLFEPTAFAGPLAAAVCGTPAVRVLWGIDIMQASGAAEHARTALAPLCARYGVSDLATLGDVTVDPCPADMQVPGPLSRLRIRYVPYNGGGVLPAGPPEEHGSSGRPRVLVHWGTTMSRLGDHMFIAPLALRALRQLHADVTVVISKEQQRLLPADTPGVVVQDRPLHALLPGHDLVVAHGGAGTLMTALTQGVPLVLLPQTRDHTFNARQAVAAGGACMVPRRELDVAHVRRAIAGALEDQQLEANALRLAAEIAAQPTPAEVAGTILQQVAARQTTRPSVRTAS